MTTTTIKLDSAVRDRLKAQAVAADRTLGEQVEHLVKLGDREQRMTAMRSAMAHTPDHLLDSYRRETAEWEAADR